MKTKQNKKKYPKHKIYTKSLKKHVVRFSHTRRSNTIKAKRNKKLNKTEKRQCKQKQYHYNTHKQMSVGFGECLKLCHTALRRSVATRQKCNVIKDFRHHTLRYSIESSSSLGHIRSKSCPLSSNFFLSTNTKGVKASKIL